MSRAYSHAICVSLICIFNYRFDSWSIMVFFAAFYHTIAEPNQTKPNTNNFHILTLIRMDYSYFMCFFSFFTIFFYLFLSFALNRISVVFFCLFEQMCIFISRGSAPKEKNLQQNIFKHRLNTDLSTKRFGMLEMIEDQNSKP